MKKVIERTLSTFLVLALLVSVGFRGNSLNRNYNARNDDGLRAFIGWMLIEELEESENVELDEVSLNRIKGLYGID